MLAFGKWRYVPSDLGSRQHFCHCLASQKLKLHHQLFHMCKQAFVLRVQMAKEISYKSKVCQPLRVQQASHLFTQLFHQSNSEHLSGWWRPYFVLQISGQHEWIDEMKSFHHRHSSHHPAAVACDRTFMYPVSQCSATWSARLFRAQVIPVGHPRLWLVCLLFLWGVSGNLDLTCLNSSWRHWIILLHPLDLNLDQFCLITPKTWIRSSGTVHL